MSEIEETQKQLEAKEKYHEEIVREVAYIVSDHFAYIKRYLPYGFHKHCREKLKPIIDELMNHEGEL